MTMRKTMFGVATVCALLFSAFAAANASAAGTTTFTCTKGEPKQFSDSHCTETGGTKEYKHVEVAPKTKTTVTSTSTTNQVLVGTLAGVGVEIVCTADTASGSGLQNDVTPMDVTGSEIVIKYTGCTVTKPAGKSCVVKGGAITTNKLKSTTSLTTSPKGVKFEPESGTEFVAITIEKCTVAALNGTFPVKGSEIGIPKGTTLETTAASSSLTFGGNVATLTGTNTVKGPSGDGLALTETAT